MRRKSLPNPTTDERAAARALVPTTARIGAAYASILVAFAASSMGCRPRHEDVHADPSSVTASSHHPATPAKQLASDPAPSPLDATQVANVANVDPHDAPSSIVAANEASRIGAGEPQNAVVIATAPTTHLAPQPQGKLAPATYTRPPPRPPRTAGIMMPINPGP